MKYMNLREEDRQLLLQLHDFIYLHKDFIEKHILNSYTGSHSIYRRLRDLEKAGYIKSFMLPINHDDHRPSKVYTLAKLGADTVRELRGIVHWNAQWSTLPPPWYMHQLMLAESIKSFEIHAADQGLRVKEWISEARAYHEFPAINSTTKQKAQIRPDGILVIGNNDVSLAIMIEMERSYTTKEKTLRKIEQFNEFFSRADELMEGYTRKVGFDEEINGWKILFIGGTEAKAFKLIKDLKEDASEVPVLVASKKDIDENPFDKIYVDVRNPEEMTNL